MVSPEHAHRKVRLPLPSSLIYDYYFNKEKRTWENWMTNQPPYVIPDNAQFHEMIIPTLSSVRISSILETLILNKEHVLLAGHTGIVFFTPSMCYFFLIVLFSPV